MRISRHKTTTATTTSINFVIAISLLIFVSFAVVADILWASSSSTSTAFRFVADNWPPLRQSPRLDIPFFVNQTSFPQVKGKEPKIYEAQGRLLSATFADLPAPELHWEKMATAPVPRLDGAAIQIKDLFFVFAGYGTIDLVHSHVDIYNFTDNTWGGRFDMPKEMAHSHLGMVTDGRYIYIVNGQYGPQCRGATAYTFVLDTDTKTWNELPPLPVPRYAPATQLWRGRLHVMGGSGVNRFTPEVDHWSLAVKDGKALEKEWRSEIPIPRGGPHRACVVADDRLMVIGGQEGDFMAKPGSPIFKCSRRLEEKLGTMLDKMKRVETIVTKLAPSLGIEKEQLQTVEDAASLAMSDLATAVVTEFTSLSGIMARHYALRDGYSQQIAEALFEITLPRYSGDILPKTDTGTVLAIADRLDSLVGLFAAGCQPSSSNDPFGLRRISYGLVQILVDNDKNLDLRWAMELAANIQPIAVECNVLDDAHQFVTRRLEQYLVDKGLNPEIVRSVLLERGNWPCLAAKSAMKMEMLFKEELLPKVIEAYSRPTRIVRGKNIDVNVEVNESAFDTEEERALWKAFLSVNSKVNRGVEIDEFVLASSELVQPLAEFFDNVFVMVDDVQVRKNRLTLLQKIADLPKGIADLSALPGF